MNEKKRIYLACGWMKSRLSACPELMRRLCVSILFLMSFHNQATDIWHSNVIQQTDEKSRLPSAVQVIAVVDTGGVSW